MPEVPNAVRGEQAAVGLRNYCYARAPTPCSIDLQAFWPDEIRNAVTELITDLLHYCRSRGVPDDDLYKILDAASVSFDDEEEQEDDGTDNEPTCGD